MKTPHKIKLLRGEVTPRYNPVTNSYDNGNVHEEVIPCFINYITHEKVFENYGSRSERVIVVRFKQEVEPFTEAIYNGKRYEPIERLDFKFKGSIRLKEVR